MLKSLRTLVFASLTIMVATVSTGGRPVARAAFEGPAIAAPADDRLSVMTYNVQGLPWPVAWGRPDALDRIGERLAALRHAGRQPHIVLLQEAFTPEAAAIARRAGYAHVATGPDASLHGAPSALATDRAYLAQGRWDRGEGLGKRFGSGLMILSDYPILNQARMAFPAFACAGFDCLANKGALIVRLAVPGLSRPVNVVNTHLNARKAAGVPVARSQHAYDRQVGLLTEFVQARVPDGEPLILGGDMNIGHDAARHDAFFGHWAEAKMDFIAPELGGARRAQAVSAQSRGDLGHAVERAKDWLFARDGHGRPLKVAQASVPFGSEEDGAPLSDHYGYVLTYRPGDRPGDGGIRLAALNGEARP
ncbi:sphingomyelin phosphodiesterase [Sphingobium sp. C100]|uniref:sphingomyelin phosphodiesterase n=1 Tax=Sphingobium sp. C100 TaxID=1207055 RepID=UPI0004CEFA5F|nr:sphingomyelin phosphodiesterase [Sphingobium sp. C100]